MKNLCIIPARGGSKRIIGKNIKDFLGKPIIAYSIEKAISTGLFDEVMVSTDCRKVSKVAEKYGASIPFYRSEKTSNDFAIINDVVEEVLIDYKNKGKVFKYVCIIFPTAPLIIESDIIRAFELMRDEGYDSVRPVVKFSYPIQRALKVEPNGRIEMFNPKFYRSRSQDLEFAYHDAGQFYWINEKKNLLDVNKGAIIIPECRVQDIDNNSDWEIAEMKYKLLNNS